MWLQEMQSRINRQIPMSTTDNDQQTELLKSIAASLKAINSSLEHLTGAVEGVAETIETAHEPEGDLGVHLVGALKELTTALHKRGQQERSFQPQQQRPQHQKQQGRRDERPARQDLHQRQQSRQELEQGHHEENPPDRMESPESFEEHRDRDQPGESNPVDSAHRETDPDTDQALQDQKSPRPQQNRRRRGSGGRGKTAPKS